MKNIVEIRYPQGERFPQISINGEKISRYMELSDLIYDDMFNWAAQMFQSMDDELCESYVVQLTGHPFHKEILTALKGQSEYCADIEFTELTYKIPVAQKLAYAAELNRQYGLGVHFADEQVMFSSDEPARFEGILPCSSEPGNYFVSYGTEFPAECKWCISISDTVRFERKRGVSYLYLPQSLLPGLADYLNQYHIHLQFISAVFAAAADMAFDELAQAQYDAYTKEEYRVVVKPLPEKLDCGQQFQVEYTYFPPCFEDPQLMAVSSAPNVIQAGDGAALTAGQAGVCTLRLVDKFGTEHAAANIRVEEHYYVSNIAIVTPMTSMRIGEKLRFQCIISPNNAEDLDQVRYTVSNENVAVLSGPNELYALSAGRVRVSVSSPRVSRSIFITVFPAASDVLLPDTAMSMPLNSIAEIHCTVVPMNANPMPNVSWTSSDPTVFRVTGVAKNACRITSVGRGTATLTCSLDGCSIRKTMQVNVEKIKGCYVATAVYGSYDCPEVWLLRRYRDQFLDSRWFGKLFIKAYYALSPTAVKLFGETKWFNTLWRSVLDRKIRKLRAKGYQDTPYND